MSPRDSNGSATPEPATKAEHNDLRAYCERRFDALEDKIDSASGDLRFLVDQIKLLAVAVDELIKDKALDDD